MKKIWNENRTNFGTAALAIVLTACLIFTSAGFASATSTSALTAPTGLQTVDRDDDELTLVWNSVSGAEGYEVYRYSSTSGEWLLAERTRDAHAEIEDLLSASTYKFKVRAVQGTQTGEFSKEFTTATAPRDVDYLRASSKTKTSVTLSWNQVRRADKYQVYKYNSNTGSWKRLITTSKTSYKVTGLSSGTYYKFKVRAVTEALGYKYYGDFEDIKVKTKSSSASSSSSGYIGLAKAKQIALDRAGVSASNAQFVKTELDYDDGVRIYEIEFYAGNYEYEFEINARTGAIYDYEKDYRWDD